MTIKYAGEKVEVTNEDVTIQNTRQKAQMSLTKVMEKDEQYGIGDNDELTKVSFGLYANEDLIADDGKKIPADGLIEVVSVSEDGTATFATDIPVGDYYVKEFTTADKYVLDDTHYEFTFDATTDKEIQEIQINGGEDIVNHVAYGTAKTIKVDAEYPKNKLSGAVFVVYSDIDGNKKYTEKKDNLIGEMKEYKKGEYMLSELPIGGYFLYEKTAPKDFVKDTNYHYFEITKGGETVNVENKAGVGFINKPGTGYLEITKRDVSDGKLLPDAGFRIKDESGKTVVEGYTDKKGILFTDSNSIMQKIEVSEQVYSCFNTFELEDISEMNEYDRHIEHSDLSESTIERRSIKQVESVDTAFEKLWILICYIKQ